MAHCIRLALASSAMATGMASAQLLDRGPSDPALIFPQWYRDLNGTAVGMCKSQAPSPNAAAGGAPMCFPLPPSPAGFAGNIGPEVFYNVIDIKQKPGAAVGLNFRYLAGLEASYLPLGVPAHGHETVFARVRIAMNFNDPSFNGDYTVTHPFGVEHFPNVQATQNSGTVPGAQASLFFTADVPLAVENTFDLALGGAIGPFIQWDVLNPGESLTVGAEKFLGDPNFPHTFTGSPFIDAQGKPQNYIKIEGPAGANLDGAGGNVLLITEANILGQLWTAPIASNLNVEQAILARSNATGLNSIDVWATSSPAHKLILTGTSMPSMEMVEDGVIKGHYHGHIEYPVAQAVPASVTVTDTTSNPVIGKIATLFDGVEISHAAYNTASGEIDIVARSTDEVAQPALVVENIPGAPGQMSKRCPPPAVPGVDQCFHYVLPANVEPPKFVSVRSASQGTHDDLLEMLTGNPQNVSPAPSAYDMSFAVGSQGTSSLPGMPGNALIVSQPSNGTVASVAGGGFQFTANAGAATGTDSFKFVVQDAASKAVSNVANGSLTLVFSSTAPTANPDQFAAQLNVAKTLNVIGNDTAASANALDAVNPTTVTLTSAPKNGTATVNPTTGAITYTARTAGVTDSFSYTVKNKDTPAKTSAPAAVQITNFSATETLSYSKMLLTSGKWTLTGATSWFGPNLTKTTVSCWLTVSGGATLNPPRLISVDPIPVLVDATGKFQVAPAGAVPLAVSPATASCGTSNGGVKAQSVTIK